MSEVEDTHPSHTKEYVGVFILLAVLTIVEIYIPDVISDTWAKGSVLTALALIKAFFVGYCFMHLRMEKKWLWGIALVPIAAAVYAAVVCLESVAR